MTAPVAWSDPAALSALRATQPRSEAADLRQVAQQFESLFLRMMLKSMREASGGDPLFDSNEGGLYRDMFDDQIAVDMATKGSLGLADILVRQLSSLHAAVPGAPVSTPPQASESPPTADTRTREDFVRSMWPHAVQAGQVLGVDPRHVVAQAALESGWGLANPGNNFFGIKSSADWRGATLKANTTEYVAGTPRSEQARFRAYGSAAESVGDYVNLLGATGRYAAVRGTGGDIDAFGRALQRGGYATDPGYATKLRAIVQSVNAALANLAGGETAVSGIKLAQDRPITASQSGSARAG